MISVDPNPSSIPMENPRAPFNPDPESRDSKVEDGSPSRSRVSESSDLPLSIHGFQTGDMVWGKVESHPWWPGHIFNEAFASPSVRRTKTGARVLVAFFGDGSYGWFDPTELIPFAPCFLEKSKQSTARSFLYAIEESVYEFNCRTALGLSCLCRSPDSFRPTHVPGYFSVDVPGFECGGIYSSDQIETARKEFVPEDCLSFVLRLVLAPMGTEAGDLECVKKTATALAFRKATYEEFDYPYIAEFPVQDDLDEETEKFATKASTLCGPEVTADPLGGSTSDNKKRSLSKDASSKKKKNKFLLKRRVRDKAAHEQELIPLSSRPQSVVSNAKKEQVKKRPLLNEDRDKTGELEKKKKKNKVAIRIDDTGSEPAGTSVPVFSAPKLDQERLDRPDLPHDLTSEVKRHSDPSSAGSKRPPLDRPEEGSSAKRIKKGTEKKATASTAMDPSTREDARLPLAPRKYSPTNLIMEFPPNKTLPSIAQLKARFVRFGKIIVEGCHVNWTAHLCRVQFEYADDALKAYEHARAKNIFGNFKVSCSVKEVEMPSEPGRRLSESWPERSSRLKSILKKPAEDVGKEGQRVRFKLDSDGSRLEPTAVSDGFRDAKQFSSQWSPPPHVRVPEPTKLSVPRSLSLPEPTNFLSPMPLQRSAIRTFENRAPVMTALDESYLWRLVQWYGDKEEESRKSNGGADDVRRLMLSAVLRANGIFKLVKSLPGFVLYRIDPLKFWVFGHQEK